MNYEININRVENGLVYYGPNGSLSKEYSDRVNPKYIKSGLAEVSENDGVFSYIKNIPKESVSEVSAPISKANIKKELDDRTQRLIIKQSSLERATEIIKCVDFNLNSENVVDIVKLIAEELSNWVLQ